MTSPGLSSSVLSSHVRVGDFAQSGGGGVGGLYAEMDAILAGIPSLQGPLTVVNPSVTAIKTNSLLTSPGGLSPVGVTLRSAGAGELSPLLTTTSTRRATR